ncbi:acyl-CoA reductase [Chitinivorax sp. B]|uniref:acyl-CoA reductase n=1 Tax=Chitinivorax sp. B TaxID=2502235 RepID=UPI0010F68186|nr:acyl-CoA reductase [Chitinivorax sp. B]
MYLAHGMLMTTADTDQVLASLEARLPATLATPLEIDWVLDCAAHFADSLQLSTTELSLDTDSRQTLIQFCQREALATKLARELGESPFSLRRNSYTSQHFESWRPLGLVVHITPANAALLPFFAVLESLLVGNINWLRPSSSDDGLSARLLAAFLSHDQSGHLADHVAVVPLPSQHLGRLFKHADGVSAWGGDAALASIRQQLPAGCRWIDWGHRISFAYVVPGAVTDNQLDALADEVCQLDQQACSSPQCVLVDSDDPLVLQQIGDQLAAALTRRASSWPALATSEQEAAEITTQLAMARLALSFAEETGQIWEGDSWRIVWSHRNELAPSPLFRTLLLRPMPRSSLTTGLQGWRTHLQSCGLIATATDQASLMQALLAAGVSRVVPPGQMHHGYEGEPHDGVMALARLARRVSVSLPTGVLPGHVTLDPVPAAPVNLASLPIMGKAEFQQQPMHAKAQLFFRSGGSSGQPKLAGFSYRDYHRQMQAAADGLFAVGIDPAQDRVMNLLYGGNLYGGMLSFFTILDKLSVTQFPMGGPADDDYSHIADMIVAQQVNTLIGMPSTIHRLFVREETTLRAYGGIRKVMLGGEQVNDAQRAYLQGFGVSLIRSAIYGSVDAGPLGHTCPHSPDGTFHLLSDTQWLEIVNQEQDQPVSGDQVGRLVFTSRAREGQTVVRYDLGDLGRWLPGPCDCGLPSPRFALTGRHGALLRVGSVFFNPSRLAEQINQPIQIVIDHNEAGTETMLLLVDGDPDQAMACLRSEPMLAEVMDGKLLLVTVTALPISQFQRHPQSGKTPLVLDRRQPACSHDTAVSTACETIA